MTFYEFYCIVRDLDNDCDIGEMNVAVSTEDGFKIVKDVQISKSCDGVGKFVELVIDG